MQAISVRTLKNLLEVKQWETEEQHEKNPVILGFSVGVTVSEVEGVIFMSYDTNVRVIFHIPLRV